jgi:chemosensory pili system protein ChpA (sensor histidine kinase/response regulator)
MSDAELKRIKTFTGLEWLVGEIETSLDAAFNELEAFTRNNDDETKIRFCLGHLHQITGPFKILEYEGCIFLVEEMESLTQAIIDKQVSNINEACEILVQAIVKLPIYLRQILSNREDRPETLILLLNDLRAAQAEPLVSEGVLFAPNLESFKNQAETQLSTDPSQPTSDMIKRLRQVYQLSLIKVIKEQDKGTNYSNLEKVLQRMAELSKGTWRASLWSIAGQTLRLVASGELKFGLALKKLFRTLDTQLKLQAAEVAVGECSAPESGIFKNLLYYLTTIQPESDALKRIWGEYNLPHAFPAGTINPDNGRLVPQYDPLVVRSLVVAIQGELAAVRSALERFSIEGGLSADEVREALPVLGNMADTLALVGQGKLRDATSKVDKTLQQIFFNQDQGIEDQDIADAVQKLAEIELALNTWAASPDKFSGTVDLDSQQNQFEFDAASQVLLAEARTDIERIKEAVVTFINSQWDLQLLAHVPAMFKELQGALCIVGLSRAAAVVAGCAAYVENIRAERGLKVEWHALDTFADAITIVEYYLEQIPADGNLKQDDVLIAAEESIQSLLLEAETDHSLGEQAVVASSELHAEPEEIIHELALLNELSESEELDQPEELEEPQELNVSPPQKLQSKARKEESPQGQTIVEDDDDYQVDAEIIEIFVEEADEVLESLNRLLLSWKDQLEDKETLATARRAFHTIKGSGRMVGAMVVGDLAWSIEELLNHATNGHLKCTETMVDLVAEATNLLGKMIPAFAANQPCEESEPMAAIVEVARRLGEGETVGQLPAELLDLEINAVLESDPAQAPKTDIDESYGIVDKERAADATDNKLEDQAEHEAILLEMFFNEAQGHLKTIDDFVLQARNSAPLYKVPSPALQRALHTLKGTAEMASFSELSELVTPLEEFIKELHHHRIFVDEDIIHLVEDAAHFFRAILGRMTGGETVELQGLPLFRARLSELREKAIGHLLRGAENDNDGKDFVAVKRLMAEGLLALQNYPALYDYLERQTTPPRVIFNQLLSDLNSIQQQLMDADIAPILELAGLMTPIYRALLELGSVPSQNIISTLKESHEDLLNLFDMLAADQDLSVLSAADRDRLAVVETQLREQLVEKAALIEASHTQASQISASKTQILEPIELQAASVETAVEEIIDEVLVDEVLMDEAPEDKVLNAELPTQDQPEAIDKSELILPDEALSKPLMDLDDSAQHFESEERSSEVSLLPAAANSTASLVDLELDNEIIGVFVEEADDIVSHIEELVMAWRSNPKETELPDRLKRDLHTLKGGARMAGFNGLGDRAHIIESLIDDTKVYDKRFFKAIIPHQEKLVSAYDIVRQIAHGGDLVVLRKQLVDFEQGDLVDQRDTDQSSAVITEEGKKQGRSDSAADFIKSLAIPQAEGSSQSMQPSQNDSGAKQQPVFDRSAIQGEIKEVVRIGAEVLDTLVNLSGENIIFRGRVEEQLSEFTQFLDEMDATVDRLQGQVRRLGTETEAQIDYRREQIEASGEADNFDPLEMDRYSHLQQLTGSLMESASDLHDLKETLNEKLIGTETLLLHQSRINTDLQEGLMKTRMVPFARIVPRLRRIVRQVGIELGKKVELRMDNIQGEMDRSVLDRMVAPLEHMIRNSVDHGIETEAERLKAGKPATGSIVITTYRQGGDIVIHLADDGRGLNVEKIRRRALEKELITEDAALSAYEISQFIFHPGFTTSDSISQISGRGVGLDVVNSEVRQCGGRVEIETSAGLGTQFTIVLPFTLSVNRALMINVTGDHYALSLNSIDGVHFMPRAAVDEAVANDNLINHVGVEYELCYLGTLLNPEISKRPDSLNEDVALVLFHSDNRRFAVQVDEIVGTKEIVVKTLGSQFSSVPGLGGATILSDGQVVVIIDLNELARVSIVDLPRIGQSAERGLEHESRSSQEVSPSILVVDDSVTVRKVTSRILRRQGYRVLTAKDGVEALKSMQEEIPAVMLLDIEMPRMDGFEVATRMRASAELSNIPIIMITSRTGDKHRQRAMELGVDHYMGKPYQEEHLLETLDELLSAQI